MKQGVYIMGMNGLCKASRVITLLFFVVLFSWVSAIAETPKTDAEKAGIIREMYQSYKKDFPGSMDISPADARALLERHAVVFVDARKPDEQEVSMLPGAITEKAFNENPEIAKEKTVVAYCTIGYRSGVFSEKMIKKGIRVMNLSGGILAWVFDGGKVYKSGVETKRVHVYGEEWNYLPEGYEAVMFGFFGKLVN